MCAGEVAKALHLGHLITSTPNGGVRLPTVPRSAARVVGALHSVHPATGFRFGGALLPA
ncbi:MAG: hypothetical protein M3548_09885 [Actinomycetota bacterium]|nr:hypothetical protein [Actinomycetota bacterium]